MLSVHLLVACINPLLVHAGLAIHAKVAPSPLRLGIVTALHPINI